MEFILTPEEAQTVATSVFDFFDGMKHKVTLERAVDDQVHFRPTVTATKAGMSFFVEAQSAPAYTTGVRELVSWVSVQRWNCEVYIAAPIDASLSGRFLTLLKRDGVGLILVDAAGSVTIHLPARNPALIVTPDPSLKLGARQAAVKDAVRKFNDGERKAALQSMCEIVEAETDKLLRRLAKRSWIIRTEEEVAKMDWSSQINTAAAKSQYAGGRDPIVDDKMKSDLHSFRGARNLIDHKVTSKLQDRKRQTQFVERMMMGPRLTAELLSLQRRVV